MCRIFAKKSASFSEAGLISRLLLPGVLRLASCHFWPWPGARPGWLGIAITQSIVNISLFFPNFIFHSSQGFLLFY
jgi:hypothetical protein